MQEGRKAQWNKPMLGAFNDSKTLIDQYLPRKCEYSGRIINSKDKSSITLNIAKVDPVTGKANGVEQVDICGYIRARGDGSAALDKLLIERGIIPFAE